jgi:murein DD-endopeptidase MepM/ murein hydrolase activator NlpD
MKKVILLVASILVAASVMLSCSKYSFPKGSKSGDVVQAPVIELPPTPRMLYGMIIDSMNVVQDKIRPNQNFGELLASYELPASFQQALANSRNIFDVSKITAHKKYTMFTDPTDQLKAKMMVYEPNPYEFIVFNFQDSVTISRETRHVDTVTRVIAGVVNSSMYETVVSQGASPELAVKLSEVFGWQIDFFRIQKGDNFKVVYKEIQVEKVPMGVGEIVAASFNYGKEEFFAFPFNQGNGVEYFDKSGNSLKKAFLKAPLKYSRISSKFSRSRFHPVQKRYKAHLGTDYAAPKGTPIHSVGEGVVLEAKYSVFNGNYVKIKHNGTISTQYLHMSKIASGIRPGRKVRQGETIGYVGSTGLASGPHLCFRFWQNGVQVDALKVKVPQTEPLKAQFRTAFEVVKTELMEMLEKAEPRNSEILARN